ncbi:pseudouridine-5'-phosphate glycosidase [Mycoplasmopsis bovis]|nr:pseudouridine-5'-phosphate glycosidase [Mycoplasmopsis bovis]
MTEGKSLEANIQLVYNNAKIAAEIAVEFSKLK